MVLKAKKEKKKKGAENGSGRGKSRKKTRGDEAAQRNRAERRQEELMARIDVAEARLGKIDAIFCEPTYYERTPPAEVKVLEAERGRLKSEVTDLMAEWEGGGQGPES